MADIKINVNQGYDELLFRIVDRISTGVYRAKSLRTQQENTAFYKGLARDRQKLDLLSAIDANYDPNDPESIRNAKKQSNKITGSKHIQQIQSFTDQKYDAELIIAEDKVSILADVAAAEKDFAKISSGKLLPPDSPLLAHIKGFAKDPTATPYSEINEQIQTAAKGMNQYLQLNEAYFGLDYDKEKGGLQLRTFNGIDITPSEFVEARSLIQQSHDLYELKDYEGAFKKLTKTAEVVADVHQEKIKQDKPRTVEEVNNELLKISTVDRVWIDEEGNKVQGEGSEKNPIGDAKWKDLKLKQDIRDEKIKRLLVEKDRLQGISPKQRENQRVIDTVNKLKETLGRIVGNAEADLSATEDLDPQELFK